MVYIKMTNMKRREILSFFGLSPPLSSGLGLELVLEFGRGLVLELGFMLGLGLMLIPLPAEGCAKHVASYIRTYMPGMFNRILQYKC